MNVACRRQIYSRSPKLQTYYIGEPAKNNTNLILLNEIDTWTQQGSSASQPRIKKLNYPVNIGFTIFIIVFLLNRRTRSISLTQTRLELGLVGIAEHIANRCGFVTLSGVDRLTARRFFWCWISVQNRDWHATRPSPLPFGGIWWFSSICSCCRSCQCSCSWGWCLHFGIRINICFEEIYLFSTLTLLWGPWSY